MNSPVKRSLALFSAVSQFPPGCQLVRTLIHTSSCSSLSPQRLNNSLISNKRIMMKLYLLTALIIGFLTHQVSAAPSHLSPAFQSLRGKLLRTVRSPGQEREVQQLQPVFEDENPLDSLDLDQLRRLAAILPFMRISDKRSGRSLCNDPWGMLLNRLLRRRFDPRAIDVVASPDSQKRSFNTSSPQIPFPRPLVHHHTPDGTELLMG